MKALLAFLHGQAPALLPAGVRHEVGRWSKTDLCQNGLHARTPDNVRISGGKRLCAACKVARQQREKRR
jgi:hypothetical protein